MQKELEPTSKDSFVHEPPINELKEKNHLKNKEPESGESISRDKFKNRGIENKSSRKGRGQKSQHDRKMRKYLATYTWRQENEGEIKTTSNQFRKNIKAGD